MRILSVSATAMTLCAGSALAGTFDLTSGTTGTSFPGQSFNETRGIDVTVGAGPNVIVTAMELQGLSIGAASSALVAARIYDSSSTAVVASADVTVTAGGTVTVPISATLIPGTSYRVAFYVATSPSNQGSGDLFDPAPSGPGGFPYVESTGQLQINSAHQIGTDSFPMMQNSRLPRISLLSLAGTQSCFPGTNGVIACPCGQPANAVGGCANFGLGSTSGAVLSASGTADLSDDLAGAALFLVTSNQRITPSGVLNVFFSYKPGGATPTTGTPSGAGVRCIGAGGDLKRLYTFQVFGGADSKPGPGDPTVSQRSASFPSHVILAPETRHYFNVYRDGQASGPCGSTAVSTNLTNLSSVAWVP